MTEKIDSKQILQMDRNQLFDFINKNQDEEGGSSSQQQSTALSMTKGIAALREAQGLSNSYAPAGAGKEIAGMAASAQYNLGVEAAQGLSPNMGPVGSHLGASDDDQPSQENKK
ncbi:MAG: hypothetical protein NTV32_01390 [Gammaproteobacteria bacterium]|nr:hypothetical protein [Gammaproteobacteria bacterium]